MQVCIQRAYHELVSRAVSGSRLVELSLLPAANSPCHSEKEQWLVMCFYLCILDLLYMLDVFKLLIFLELIEVFFTAINNTTIF